MTQSLQPNVLAEIDPEPNHVDRLIELYKRKLSDTEPSMAEFISNYLKIQTLSKSKKDIDTTIDLPFGIDLLFYVLYSVTNSMLRFISGSQPALDTLDETKNPELRKLRLEATLEERKLKNMCDLVANYGGFKAEQILPDRASYAGIEEFQGMVDSSNYENEWK